MGWFCHPKALSSVGLSEVAVIVSEFRKAAQEGVTAKVRPVHTNCFLRGLGPLL